MSEIDARDQSYSLLLGEFIQYNKINENINAKIKIIHADT